MKVRMLHWNVELLAARRHRSSGKGNCGLLKRASFAYRYRLMWNMNFNPFFSLFIFYRDDNNKISISKGTSGKYRSIAHYHISCKSIKFIQFHLCFRLHDECDRPIFFRGMALNSHGMGRWSAGNRPNIALGYVGLFVYCIKWRSAECVETH